MRFSTLSTALLLPLLAVAQYPTDSSTSLTTTITSTQTMTKTITVSQVVAAVTSTYGYNTTAAVYAPTAGSVKPSSTYAAASTSIPANFMGAASNLNGMYAGSAGVMVMIVAAFL